MAHLGLDFLLRVHRGEAVDPVSLAAEVDAVLAPRVAAAAAVVAAPGPFQLRRAIELAEQLVEDLDADDGEVSAVGTATA